MLQECIILLCAVSLQFDVTDFWRWELDPSEGYTVCAAYNFLATQVNSYSRSKGGPGSLWQAVRSWLRVSGPNTDIIFDHFY